MADTTKATTAFEQALEADKANLPTWDLTEFYSGYDDPQVKADIEQAKALAAEHAAKYKGRVAQLSGDELADALEAEVRICALAEKPYHFASYSTTLDGENPKTKAFEASVIEQYYEVSEPLQFLDLEIKRMTDDALQARYDESPRLQALKPVLDQVRRYIPHTLPDDVESVLTKKGPVDAGSLMNRLYDEAEVALRFDVGGEQLTYVEMDVKLDSPDRAVREEAMRARAKAYTSNIRIPVFAMNTIIKDKQIDDDIRGYKGDMTRRNTSNNVEAEVVDALIDTVTSNYANTSNRYYALKAKMLGLEGDFDDWDLRAPQPDAEPSYIPWEQAKKIVLDSYREFSPEMADIAQRFFDEGWIDAAPRPGKASGAYCSSDQAERHPFVMVNYTGTARDVMTLAHELGHGVHAVLEKRRGGDMMPHAPINLAETASLFGEELVFNKLLKEIKNPTERKLLLASKIEDEIGTIVRQACWVDFERKVHAQRREGELTQEDFAKNWKDVMDDFRGPSVKGRAEGWENEWSRIPHMFHTPFYMYGYSFGNLLVNSLFKAHEEGKIEGFEAKYLDALSAGGSKHHSDLLKPFGLDASQPDFWQKGLDVLTGRIDQLEVAIAEEKALKASLAPVNDNAPVAVESIQVVGAAKGAEKAQVRGV